MMSSKEKKYLRLIEQIKKLTEQTCNFSARIATIIALLHHKMNFFWTGFYLLDRSELIVYSYQGPLACQKLEKDKGVCWAAINQRKTIVVKDVEKFPGHIACNALSKSEIVVPFFDNNKKIVGCLDIDSQNLSTFDKTDAKYLKKIVKFIF